MAEEKQKKDKHPKQQQQGGGKGGGKGEKKAKKPAGAEVQDTGGDEQSQQPAPPARLAVAYREQISPALMQRFGYTNRLEVPRLEKIVISMGLGKAVTAGEKGKMEQ